MPTDPPEMSDAEKLEKLITRAAIAWCGRKDRETFPEDIEYYRHNWRSLSGLRDFLVEHAATRIAELEAENARLREGLANSIQFAGGRSPATCGPSGSAGSKKP